MSSVPERDIQAELYRFLRNVMGDQGFSFEGIEFRNVVFEPTIDGRPDLVVEAVERGKRIPILIIETKRKVPYRDPKFDPFSKDVIMQAERYAMYMGAPYFATCNGERFVLFETFKVGVPLPQRRLKDYRVFYDEKFAEMILKEVGRFRIGVGKWLPLDDIFVQRLRSFHGFITPFIQGSLTEKLRADEKYRERYVAWLKSQLFEYSEEMNERIAEQAAYLLVNKITFYKTLETQISLPELKRIDAANGEEYSDRLRQHFDKVLDVNYEAIFQRSILDEIPFPVKLMEVLNDFIEELGTYNLARIQSDVLGRVYEELIPGEERHRLGQYYTPPPIVELIVEMCVRSPKDVVLDPGCGSGSFLVKAYHKLKDLKLKENPFRGEPELHKELLNQIYGIDINPFPAQLSSINLAVRNLKVRSENINLFPSDFFKIEPGMPLLPKEFDVVVTNPPYTRQEEMEYKQQIRDVALTYTDGSKIEIDARAGIYAYFFTHSAKFLKNGGRMGYITSNTWLDVGFGEGLKKFFLDHFKILAIIEHDAGVFEKPVVDTCITILEKADKDDLKQIREENIVKFLRIKKPMDIQNLVDVVKKSYHDYEDEKLRLVHIKQGELTPEDKWGKYLRAPAVYFKLVNCPKITKLERVAKVRYGLKPGAVDFFILGEEEVKQWGIEESYISPLINEPSDLKHVDVIPEDIDKYILMVHKNKDELKGTNVLKYIEEGEKTSVTVKKGSKKGETLIGYHNLATLKSRTRWYNLGIWKSAPIISCVFVRDRFINVWNKAGAIATNNFHEIYPNNPADTPVLLAFFHSAIGELMMELQGRQQGAGLLQIMTYEREQLPILNPEKLTQQEKKKFEEAIINLCKAQREGNTKLNEKRQEISDLTFDILSLSPSERQQVYDGLKYIREMRTGRKQVEILVETPEKWKPSRKRKKIIEPLSKEPSKRLDLWLR